MRLNSSWDFRTASSVFDNNTSMSRGQTCFETKCWNKFLLLLHWTSNKWKIFAQNVFSAASKFRKFLVKARLTFCWKGVGWLFFCHTVLLMTTRLKLTRGDRSREVWECVWEIERELERAREREREEEHEREREREREKEEHERESESMRQRWREKERGDSKARKREKMFFTNCFFTLSWYSTFGLRCLTIYVV